MRTTRQRVAHHGLCFAFIGITVFFGAIVYSYYAYGKVERDYTQVHKFRKEQLCPATKKVSGPCGDWVVDHKMPLCAGGADKPENMQWQRYRESKLKDKEELALCRFMSKNQIPREKGMETLCAVGKQLGWMRLYSLHCQ